MKKSIKGYASVTEDMRTKYFKEEFQGEVVDVPIKWPKELGAEHPFNFEDCEKVFRKIGIVNGIINKWIDNIVGEFSVKVENPNSQKIIDDFIKTTNFSSVIREWIEEALVKGNGFIEIDLKTPKIRVLNANNMYVLRDIKGKVKKYHQYVGNITRFNPNSKKLIPFEPNQIAHLKLNKISGCAYAQGIVMPNERVIENLVQLEQDYVKLVKRKAGAPIHAKLGQPGESVQSEDIDALADKLKFMNTRTEWATDGNVEFKVIDFGQLGDSVSKAIEHTYRQLIAGMQTPEVLLGSGQLNEGIGNVQLEGWQRTAASIQEEAESIIEEQIFRPILKDQGLDESIKFSWNLPSETEINARIEKLTALLGNFNITENMKRIIQIEIAKLLDIEDYDQYLIEPEVGVDEEQADMEKEVKQAGIDGAVAKAEQTNAKVSNEAKKESKIRQPEVPGAKPNAREEGEIDITAQSEVNLKELAESGDIKIRDWVNFNELKGFNYSDYLVSILKRLKVDKFEDLAALNEADLEKGLLGENDIKKLRIILKDGFRRNKTIRQIENEVKNNINFKDRLDEDGKLQLTAESRPNIVTRTETVRIANAGLLDSYKENDVNKVRWLAALSDRTCPQCEAKNGEVYKLNESYNKIPLHPNCRCTWISI